MSGSSLIVWCLVLAGVAFALARLLKDRQHSEATTEAIINSPGFQAQVYFKGRTPQAPAVGIDARTSQFVVAYGGDDLLVFGFQDLVGAEVFKNGTSVTITNRGSQVAGAAVGALLLGPIGLLLGGATGSRRSEEKLKRISLTIYTSDLDRPSHDIVFLDSPKGLKPDRPEVREALQQAADWYGRFQTILRAGIEAPRQPRRPPPGRTAPEIRI